MNFTTQGVRLDRVRGGRQKYKRRPEVDPLPFPGPFPAGPLAVAGGPRKTGEDPGFLSFGGRGAATTGLSGFLSCPETEVLLFSFLPKR